MANVVTKNMDLFFYIKNSADYPPGQVLTDKFGYETTISGDGSRETVAIFNYTIKDLYNKLSTPKEVNNLYQLNKIDGDVIVNNDSIFTTSKEYTSSMIINNGKFSDYDNVNPDYNISDLDKLANGTIDRNNVFWRKMFSLFEYLKYNESNIVNKVNPSGIDTDELRGESLTIYNAEAVIGKYILAFVANNKQFTSNDTPKDGVYNEYRKKYFNPIYSDTWTADGTDEKNDLLWQNLNISYNPKSASIVVSSKYENRIDKITFTVQYYNANGSNGNNDTTYIWTFNIYFTPDAIIEAKAGSSYEVWTYNDADLDSQYKDTSGNFNILDNDYANTLSKDETIKKSFVVSKDEMASAITKKIVEITKEGLYSGYVEFKTTRVSPYIEPASDDGSTLAHVVWDNNNRIIQTFYIFYPSTEPTSTEQQAAVQSYLKKLHADCHPETRDDKGNVIYIGHGSTNEELNVFLSKMYPELFSLSSVSLIPIINDRFIGTSNAYDPAAYVHPVSVYDICRTIKLIPGFSNFGFNTDGSYEPKDDSSRAGVEVLYLGGLRDTEGKIIYDFPVLCTRSGNSSSSRPFTDIEGMNYYRQMNFDGNNVPSKSPDLIQFILLKLFEKMFIQGIDKAHIGQIGETTVTYSYESTYDPDNILMGANVGNVARFTINSIEYCVYAQRGKNFGSFSKTETINAD